MPPTYPQLLYSLEEERMKVAIRNCTIFGQIFWVHFQIKQQESSNAINLRVTLLLYNFKYFYHELIAVRFAMLR